MISTKSGMEGNVLDTVLEQLEGNKIDAQGIRLIRLCEAAPDMLDALRSIIFAGNVDCGTYWKIDASDIAKVKAAIDKAEGRGRAAGRARYDHVA